MSVVAKILIVLNLVLAVVFLGAASTFLGEQEAWKHKFEVLTTEYQSAEDDWNIQRTALNADLDGLRGQLTAKQVEATDVKARLESKESEFEAVTRAYTEMRGQYERLSQVGTDTQAMVEQLTKDKNELVNQKEQAMTEKRQAIEAKNDAIIQQRRLEGELVAAADAIGGLEAVVNKAAMAAESNQLVIAAYMDKFGALPSVMNPPKITAVVTGVSATENIVMLSVGRDDKVKAGFEFKLYRGRDYVGTIVINRVEGDWCAGYSKKELERLPIQSGDSATTQF